MARETAGKTKPLRHVTHLPLGVVTPTDINRLSRELTAIDDSLLEETAHKGEAAAKVPKTSQLMDELVGLNKLHLAHKADRQLLRRFLAAISTQAPIIHMSFSADPSPVFMEKLVAWLRREVHPQVLLTVGLQPTIGAGCIVRTNNHQFDFSMRQNFAKKRSLLIEKLTPDAAKPTLAPAETAA